MTDQQRPDQYPTGEGTSAVAYGAAGDPGAGLGGDEAPTFLADLAHAMQVTAAAQRLRITEAADERRQARIDEIRGRETTESEELREVAERDVKGIESWATAEIERIRLERQRRIAARKTELERRLEQHHTLIEREIAAVEAAVVAYRDEVERFFGRLDVESDPIAIAREAGKLPPFPVLEVIGPDDSLNASDEASEARTEPPQVGYEPAPTEAQATYDEPADRNGEDQERDGAVAEPEAEPGAEGAGVLGEQRAGEPIAVGAAATSTEDSATIGVMESEAPAAGGIGAGDRDGGAATGSDAEAPAAEEEPDETEPLVGTGPKVAPRSSGAIIQSVPSLRPIGSWLRRSNNSNESD